MTEVTSEGKRLIECWLNARQSVDQCKRAAIRAGCDLSNAHTALAKWILPDDAKPGEKIGVWHGDSLIQVEVACGFNGGHVATVRTRGKRGVDGHGRG